MNILENFNKYYSNLTESTLLNEATLSQVVDQMWAGLAASKTEGELRKRMAQYWAYANNEPPRNKEMLLARLDGLFARAEQELLPHIKAKEIADKQFTAAGTTGYSSSNEICFDLFGIAISNPFVTPDTTMELSLEEAYAYYGIANMNWFIDKCNEA